MVHSPSLYKIKLKHRKPITKMKRYYYARKFMRQIRKEYFAKQCRETTIHGIPYIVNDKLHPIERAFWAVSFLSCFILAFYLLAAQFSRFIETPTVMSVEMDYFNWNVSYPAFTLCPNIIYKIDADRYLEFLNETKSINKRNSDLYFWVIATVNMETLDHLLLQDLALIDPRNYTSLAVELFKKFDNSSLTTNNNWPISVELAMTEFGMCHVLNSNVAVFDNPLKWHGSAPTYAKNNIELSVHDRDFFTQIMNYAEIYKVFIHSADETILATTSSNTQSLKGFLSFGVQVWTTRISEVLRTSPINLRKCRFVTEPINKRYNIYSYNHCLLECRIQMIINLCGCIPHFYKPLDHERICTLNELRCVKQYKREILSLSASEETRNRFPDKKDLPKSSKDCKCLSQCEVDVYQKDFETFIPHSSMSRLRVGISHFPKSRIVRNIIFNFDDVVLKVGGVLNLCVGASILSFMEFLIPVIKVAIYVLTTMLKRQ